MCFYSMIADHYREKYRPWNPYIIQTIPLTTTDPMPPQHTWPALPGTGPTKHEFDALKADFEDMKKLLDKAKKYDAATGQPDCEMEEKVRFLKDMAKFLGVEFQV